jgi:hypothetical protein
MEQIHQIVDNEARIKWWFDEHAKLTVVDGCFIYCPYIPIVVKEKQDKEKSEKK